MFTMIGNLTLALAALQLFRRQRQREMDHG
jgi:hypothetical protein